MKKERLPKGHIYHYISDEGYIEFENEQFSLEDNRRYYIGNYFSSREDADIAVENIHAILRGADVIETPTAEEVVKTEAQMNPYVENLEASRYTDGFFFMQLNG